MVFADNPASHFSSTVVPLFISFVSCLLTSSLALASLHYNEGLCSDINKFTIVTSACMLASCLGMWYIRNRYHSLHITVYLILWIIGAVFALLLPLAMLGYAIYGITVVIDKTTVSNPFDPIEAISVSICKYSSIHSPAVIVIVLTFLCTILFFPFAARIIISRMIFMKPAVWWADYTEHLDSIRWLRTALGDLIPTMLIKSGSTNPRYTLIYSHGNASDLGVMIQGLQHLAKHINCHIVVYDYPGYGLGANTGYLDEQHVYASIEAVFRATLLPANVWGVTLPKDVVLFGRSLGTAVCIHLAALLGDAERYGRANGDLTGARGADPRSKQGVSGADAPEPETDAAAAPGEVTVPIPADTETRPAPRRLSDMAPATPAAPAAPSSRPTFIGGQPVRGPERLCGIVLDSPLASVVRTKLPISRTLPGDLFCSVDKAARVAVPAHVSHGLQDKVVPPWHAEQLLARLGGPWYPPTWLENKGHNDLPKFWIYQTGKVRAPQERKRLELLNEETRAYLLRFRKFLCHCDSTSLYHSAVETDQEDTSDTAETEFTKTEALSSDHPAHDPTDEDCGEGLRAGPGGEGCYLEDDGDDGLLSLPAAAAEHVQTSARSVSSLRDVQVVLGDAGARAGLLQGAAAEPAVAGGEFECSAAVIGAGSDE